MLSDSANRTLRRAVVLTQYRRVTDGRTDRKSVADRRSVQRELHAGKSDSMISDQ